MTTRVRTIHRVLLGLLVGTTLVLATTAARADVVAIPQASVVARMEQAAAHSVCHSVAEMRKAAGEEFDALAKALRPDSIDFSKKMVVVIRAGRVNAFGVKVRVTSFERSKDGKSATVHWLYKPYFGGAAPPNQPGNPTLAAVLDRFDGSIKFQRKNWRPPVGHPLPPSAPPSQPPALNR